MVNSEKGEVLLHVKGKPYTLALKTAGLVAIQNRLSPANGPKMPLVKVIGEMERAIKTESLEHVVLFLWAALQKYHKGMTEDDAMNLIDDVGGIPGLEQTFGALSESMTPDPADVEEMAVAGGKAKNRKAQAKM